MLGLTQFTLPGFKAVIFKIVGILIQSSLPIAATTFGLVWWARRKGYLGDASSMDEYEGLRQAENKNRKAEKKRRKQAKKLGVEEASAMPESAAAPEQKFDPLHSKWMEFGGGFYGVVAVFTYLVIEVVDVWELVQKVPELFSHGVMQLVIGFFVESFKNFITAITWPAYWLDHIDGEQWLWAIGAYGGYWLGAKLAFRKSTDTPGSNSSDSGQTQ